VGLKEKQDLLALLLTDAGERDRFYADPENAGRQAGLTRDETADVSAMIGSVIDEFAVSLIRKRHREVQRHLPFTRKVLEARFWEEFEKYSSRPLPAGPKKHLRDAADFCTYLLGSRTLEAEALDAVRFDRARILFSAADRTFALFLSRHNLVGRRSRLISRLPGLPRFAVWLRLGKQSFHFSR
jgi:hypothetical protein